MAKLLGEGARWAEEELGRAELGDSRRTARLVRMAARAAERPSGKISAVFTGAAELQGAYDLLETGRVAVGDVLGALARATMGRAASEGFIYVAVDGSSLGLADHACTKDFGSVGSLSQQGRGLKVISALGIGPDGTPLGLCAQSWWSRTTARRHNGRRKRQHNLKRKAHEKETQRWLDVIDDACGTAKATATRLWFVLDREADNRSILNKLAECGQLYTVRNSWNRVLAVTGLERQYLRTWLGRIAPCSRYELDVPAGRHRAARAAQMIVRFAPVELRLRDKWCKTLRTLRVNAVWAREEGTTPTGEKPIDWLLFTNAAVETAEQARHVLFGYTQRWRIEEFHKTWKSGGCNVELAQLRSARAMILWATILAAVAVRIERLKRLARTTPDQPASVELTPHEIRALIVLKREFKKRTETIPDTMPTIGQATLWIAELGGYTGKSSGGPPGSITIQRGYDRLRPAAMLLEALQRQAGSDQ